MKRQKKYLVLLVLLLVAAGFVFIDGRFSKKAVAVDLNRLPLALGDWQGKNYPVDERILRILETEYILDRQYFNRAGNQVYLSIVYYPDNKIGFHNPESCNTGEGSKIIKKDVFSIKNGTGGDQPEDLKVNRLILNRMNGNKVIMYFFVSGNYMTHDYFKFRLHMMKQQMSFHRPSGAQVQIHSMVVPDLNPIVPPMEDFIRNFAPLFSKYLF